MVKLLRTSGGHWRPDGRTHLVVGTDSVIGQPLTACKLTPFGDLVTFGSRVRAWGQIDCAKCQSAILELALESARV